jgi:hypothetical protein
MTKNELKIFILETILEAVKETNNYPPDKWEDDFKLAIEDMIKECEWRI